MPTAIPFLDECCNAIVGCARGCPWCWAARLHNRRHRAYCAGKKLPPQYERPFEEPQFRPSAFERLAGWKKPRIVGWNFTGDTWGETVPESWTLSCLEAADAAPQHIHIWFTKCAKNMAESLLRTKANPPQNWFLYFSAADQAAFDAGWRAARRLAERGWRVGACLEPLLGPVCIPTAAASRLSSVIVGGQSGPGAAPMHPDWPRAIRDQCKAAGTLFYFKQWGEWVPWEMALIHPAAHAEKLFARRRGDIVRTNDGMSIALARVGPRRAGRLLDGREHNALPWTMARSGNPLAEDLPQECGERGPGAANIPVAGGQAR